MSADDNREEQSAHVKIVIVMKHCRRFIKCPNRRLAGHPIHRDGEAQDFVHQRFQPNIDNHQQMQAQINAIDEILSPRCENQQQRHDAYRNNSPHDESDS